MLKKIIFSLFLILVLPFAQASSLQNFTSPPSLLSKQPQVLPAHEAFKLLITFNADRSALELHWQITPDYYLYRDKIKFNAPFKTDFLFPPGKEIIDEFFGNQIVYFDQLSLQIPIPQNAPAQFAFDLNYQGCALAGFCYPPIHETWQVDRINASIYLGKTLIEKSTVAELNELRVAPTAVTNLLEHTSLGWVFIIFFVLGLLLTFTPCVLPMIPILSGIIMGQKASPRSWHGFGLSFSYVWGVVLTYTVAGIFAGFAGMTLQSYLQSPLFITISALILLFLAFSLFGFYPLHLPTKWHNKLHHFTQSFIGGRYVSAFILGILSALIVSPCVTAPLIGALTYIGITGDAILGGSALFALAWGMGTPLLVIGTIGPHVLPRAGKWLSKIQYIFGVLLIVTAIWLISRLLPESVSLILYGITAVISAIYMGALQTQTHFGWARLRQGIAWVILICGVLLLTKGAQILFPQWAPSFGTTSMITSTKSNFIPVKTWSDVEKHIMQSQKPILLDIYADWCVTCKVIEQKVFPDPKVASLLSQFTLLRADVTAQDSQDKALQQQLKVFAPPALIFFAAQGQELKETRLVGDLTPEILAQHLEAILYQ